ncbi:MAG: hypothetical protein SOW67_05680 [Fusobacterium necrophorum]|nr:hypothetical protein [Fusobacterium necrophorum]
MKNNKLIVLTLLFTLFFNSSILEAKERTGERSDRTSSLAHSNKKERERREKLEYDGKTWGLGKTIGGGIGGGIGGYAGSKFKSPIEKSFGGFAGAEIGSRIGGRLGDRWERRTNQYSHDRWNNRKNGSTAWRCSLNEEEEF